MMRSLFLFFFTLSTLSAIAQTDSVKAVSSDLWLVKKGFKMKYPANWEVSQPCSDTYCSVFSPGDTLGFMDSFRENINFTVSKLSPGYTVDQYATYSLGYLPKVVKGFEVLDKKKLKSNAYRITYRGTKDNFAQTWRQYYYVKNNQVFIVTFAAETSKYTYYQPFIEPYLASFVLL